ncbi:hypothetical protein BGZ60DRAFT_429415 [Tricladium varicosporioides]|nr:hypothetical protein BGZ60DRAFT_429415 [Hymenoscyphus varicosporioides]
MSSSSQARQQPAGGVKKKGGAISKKGQPKKDIRKLLADANAEESEEEIEDGMLTEERDSTKQIKDGKTAKLEKMIMSSINDASLNQADGPSSPAVPEHRTNADISNDNPEAPASSPFVGSSQISSNSQEGHPPLSGSGNSIPSSPPSGPLLSGSGNPIPDTLATPSPGPLPGGPGNFILGTLPNISVNTPVIDLVDEMGEPQPLASVEDLDDDDAGLFTPEQNKVVTGRVDDGIVVAWRQQGYSKQVIIRHGPKNSPKYECSTKVKAGIPFDEKTTPQTGPDHRFGDEKIDRKFIRQYNEFKGMLGVAYNCPLEDLRPRKVSGNKRYPRVQMLVKWEIKSEVLRVWEVVSSVKHIWPSPTQCEEYIYNVACDHHKKHQAWLSGEREGRDATPTPGPDTNMLMPTGPQVITQIIKPEQHESSGTPLTNIASSDEARMLQFRQQWAALQKPKLDPENLSMKQQFTFLNAWNEWNEEEL